MTQSRVRAAVSFCGLFVGCCLLSGIAFAEIPHLIRYQGQAVDVKGVPLQGPYTLTVRLYDAETGGTVMWQETQKDVPLTSGHFSVLLGGVTPLDINWTKTPLWLTVQVNSEPELLPRQRITSVPLAIRAEQAELAEEAKRLTQAIAPTLITPQGSGSGLDADTVDGQHTVDLLNRANHTGTQPTSTVTGTFAPAVISPQGSGSGLDADMVDGKHAAELVRRGQMVYRCPFIEPRGSCNGGDKVGSNCIGQISADANCTWYCSVPSPNQRLPNVTQTRSESCEAVGYLLPQ